MKILKHSDIYIPWSIFISFYLFIPLFYFQISILMIFPIIILIYKEVFNIKNYFSYNKKTKINFSIYFFICFYCIVFIFYLPFFEHNRKIENFYENKIYYSCTILKLRSNSSLINDFNFSKKIQIFQYTPNYLINLINKIGVCHDKNKTKFLEYILLKGINYNTFNTHENVVAIPIKHTLISIYNKPMPVFDYYYPDSYNGKIPDNYSDNDIINSLNNIKIEIEQIPR